MQLDATAEGVSDQRPGIGMYFFSILSSFLPGLVNGGGVSGVRLGCVRREQGKTGFGFGVRVLGFGDRLGKMGAILVLVGFSQWIWGL